MSFATAEYAVLATRPASAETGLSRYEHGEYKG